MKAAQIRELGAVDAEPLFRLRRHALLDAPLAFAACPEDDLATSVAAVRELLSRGRGSAVFGAFHPELVGMLGLYRDRHVKAAHKVHLWGMYVRPDVRRRGLGRRLLDAALERTRTMIGASSVRLSVSEAAGEAKRLYERAGFRVWGIEPEALRYAGQSAREYYMILPLMPDRTGPIDPS
jgi:ribosomal protein S18 acetylase RimI-like enzyme